MSPWAKFKTESVRCPSKTIVLEPWAFRDTWPAKPSEPIAVGLRFMSDSDKSRARSEADRIAHEHHRELGPAWLDSYNDALMRQLAAIAICDPNDVTRPCEILTLPEDEVEVALTARGARFIFESYELHEVLTSRLAPEATDEDLDDLSNLLMTDALQRTSPGVAASLRRLAWHMLDQLRNAEEAAA